MPLSLLDALSAALAGKSRRSNREDDNMAKIIAQKGSDKIEVEILDDGSLKITTDKISAANHGSAEILIRELITNAGGDAQRTRKGHAHDHSHEHDHTHTH